MPHTAPVDVAVRFVEAFGKADADTIAGLFADDIVFESPRVRIAGAAAVLAAISEFAKAVQGVDVVAALGDDEKAVVVYDMKTAPFGTIRAVDYLVVRDGKIISDSLVFDTYEVRKTEASDS